MGRRLVILCMLTFLVSGCSVSREQRKVFVGYPALQNAVNRSTSGQVPDDRQSKDRDLLPPAQVDHVKALHFVPATIEYGEPRPIIDSVGWMFGLPRRILLWDQRVDNHQVSKETVTAVGEYLATNRIDDVTIRVNQYAPLDEWRRLRTNQRVGAGWRYTFGLGHWVAYTLFPGRIWGGDWYNPYSNTVHLYSDVPQLGLVETAYAKDISSQEFPGTYATVQTLPIVALWHETKATNDVISYIALNGTIEEMEKTKRLLYARYGMTVGGDIGSLQTAGGLVVGNVYQVVGAVAGHTYAGLESNGM